MKIEEEGSGHEVAGSSPVAPTGWKIMLRKQFGYLPTSGSAFGNPK